ncbi:hypothetical protein FOA43_004779 [Brettanomyces nanus]|uniref:Peroxin-19 n=1 Tax=Eeniella nana TaxID=13502 RepID=A0A875S7N9_EENNA|nr:uncharacterized protein FOA43_004779 [Brettanomyces nanus]QPG77366.1 hypothetical protein FOA43_004779 [Brettanomyces nanus]
MRRMAQNDPELSNDLEGFLKDLTGKDATKLEGSSAKKDSPSNDGTNFQHVISETVNRLKTSGNNVDKTIHEESKDDELLATLLKSLNLDIGKEKQDGDGTDISKLLVDMLDKLSSKTILYEPLNDLYLKFGPWLAESKNKTNSDYSKYQDQYEIVKKIVFKFQESSYDDDNSHDKEFINTNLEQLQELGLPPKELVNDDLNFLNFKGAGNQNGSKDPHNLEFGDDDIPEEVSKELEDTCQQT